MKKKGTWPRLCLTVFLAVILAGAAALASAEGTVSVYFNNNAPEAKGGTAVTVNAGETVTPPADPVREGYLFRGWYTNTVCNKPYDFSAPVTEDTRLFAGWAPVAVTVTWEMNGPELPAVQATAKVGEKLEAIDAPVREGYRFAGWFLNASGTKAYDFDQPVAGKDMTLYAGWTQEQATVTCVLYDDLTETLQAEFDQPLPRPEDPRREDYAFAGWFTTLLGADPVDFEQNVTGDMRIYAHWIQTVALVTFDTNCDDVENEVRKVTVGEPLAELPKPDRAGYRPPEWFVDAALTQEYDAAAPVTEDMTLYASWKPRTYTVTFDENYSKGGTTKVKAQYGEVAEPPEDPTRSKYDFIGWYLEAKGGDLYDVTAPVTGSITVYAHWQSQSKAAGERVYTYMLNYDDLGVYETQTFTSTQRVKEPEKPVRPGYYFAGWYRDAEGTTAYDFSNERSVESTTLHAKWLPGYTFEAEYTFLDGKPGQGSSDNCMGTDIIQSPKDVVGNGLQMGMSNGYYVGKLYYNGAFLVFDILSDREVTDAVLVLRLTPDLFDMRFTDETWQVLVNGERVPYGRLNLTGAVAQTDFDAEGNSINGDMNKRPFENYVLSTSLHLKEGSNQIRLVTNNKEDHGGTFNAETPLIDCLYIYADAALSWESCYPQNVGQTMDDVSYAVTFDTLN